MRLPDSASGLIAVAVCEGLQESRVSPIDLHDCACVTVEKLCKALGQDSDFSERAVAAVDDFLHPPSDGDFEHLSDSYD